MCELRPDLKGNFNIGFSPEKAIPGNTLNEMQNNYRIIGSNKKTFNLVKKIHSKFSKNKIPLNVSDFQLVDRKIIDKFILLKDNFPFTRTLAFEYSDNFDTVSYTWQKRKFGKSKEPLKDYINTAMNGLVSVSDTPFRLILILGFIR